MWSVKNKMDILIGLLCFFIIIFVLMVVYLSGKLDASESFAKRVVKTRLMARCAGKQSYSSSDFTGRKCNAFFNEFLKIIGVGGVQCLRKDDTFYSLLTVNLDSEGLQKKQVHTYELLYLIEKVLSVEEQDLLLDYIGLDRDADEETVIDGLLQISIEGLILFFGKIEGDKG